ALVRSLGLPGVALATLVPVGIASSLVLFPAACRRVELPLRHALLEAVWPAVWPAAVMAGFVLATRDLIPPTLPAVAVEIAAACAVYAVVFVFFGISATHRQLYFTKAAELLRRRTAAHPVPEGT